MKHPVVALLLLLASCGQQAIQARNTSAGKVHMSQGEDIPHGTIPPERWISEAQRGSLREIDETRAKIQPFLDAVAQVESMGCDNVIGDKGKAIGRMQIWNIYWQDALYYCPKIGGEYQDCKTKVYAERVVVAYLLRYARKAIEAQDWQTLARIHNGGPKGATKEATRKYWVKVRKELAKRK